jgi:hypothetical protein
MFAKKFGESKGSVKNFYGVNLSIYRGEVQFQEAASIRPLRVFRGTRFHSDVPRVAFFTKVQNFCGNRSSESTRFPEGLVLGNSVKPLHPRNVRVLKRQVM